MGDPLSTGEYLIVRAEIDFASRVSRKLPAMTAAGHSVTGTVNSRSRTFTIRSVLMNVAAFTATVQVPGGSSKTAMPGT
jgi:hypothetical protein